MLQCNKYTTIKYSYVKLSNLYFYSFKEQKDNQNSGRGSFLRSAGALASPAGGNGFA